MVESVVVFGCSFCFNCVCRCWFRFFRFWVGLVVLVSLGLVGRLLWFCCSFFSCWG